MKKPTKEGDMDFEQATDNVSPPVNIITFLQTSPLAKAIAEGCEFDFERQQDLPRDIDFD